MQIDFILGPAGSGKNFRCLAETRAALAAGPEGLPLVFLAPKQATFQLERELLADPALPGYTRLQILSFDRLAEFILNQFVSAPPRVLSEEGRVMVLRALLAHNYSRLKLYHTSARRPGFARQLSQMLNEFQQHQLSPEQLKQLAEKKPGGMPQGMPGLPKEFPGGALPSSLPGLPGLGGRPPLPGLGGFPGKKK